MSEEFKNKLINLSTKINIELSDENAEKFYNYMNLLLEWNEKINLTAITEEDDIILKHFIDSLTVLKYIKDGEKIIDVGTGAGFPGIPIAIEKKKCQITLLDSLNKRILFLEDVANKINLENVRCIHGRAEDLGQNKQEREKYDISISRAVANLSTLVEYLMPFVRIGGKVICMKGPDCDEEIENAKFAIKELGGKIAKVDTLQLPDSDISRTIIIIEKIKETPNKYPRKAGLPSKEPLTFNNKNMTNSRQKDFR